MSINVKDLVKDLNLEVLISEQTLDRIIDSDLLARPGVELVGFFDFYDPNRIVLFGSKEASFMQLFDEKTMKERIETLFKKQPPCMIFSRNVYINDMFFELGHTYGVPILRSTHRTTALASLLYNFLHANLAPRKTLHGVLVDIHGLGTLIIGKSGIGKSETALELIKRGHLLVADDRVDMYEASAGSVIGYAPDITKKLIEVRGIGIVNVVEMYGAGAFREDKKIRLVVELEAWNEEKHYDRLGVETEHVRYFETELPKITIPVLPGRNVATLVESAADNMKLKYLGYDAAKDFVDKINKKAEGKEG
jgi:HPr kinase/phosphorylase